MKTSYLIAILALLIIGGSELYQTYLMVSNPFKYHHIKAITETVKRGDYFIEELDIERFRICKVDIDRFIVNKETKDVFYRERIPGGATPLGRFVVTNKILIPPDAPTGRAILIQNVASACVSGTHTMPWPVLEFTIE